jgi:hypothetical protein
MSVPIAVSAMADATSLPSKSSALNPLLAVAPVGQFMYASHSLPEGRMSAHYATYRLSFAINVFVVEDTTMIEGYTPGPNVLHPGFLKSEATESKAVP